MATRDGDEPVRTADAGPLAIRTQEGRRWAIELRGELDISNAHILNQELFLAGTSDAEEIVVDLSQLTFMDSTGLHVPLRAADRARPPATGQGAGRRAVGVPADRDGGAAAVRRSLIRPRPCGRPSRARASGSSRSA